MLTTVWEVDEFQQVIRGGESEPLSGEVHTITGECVAGIDLELSLAPGCPASRQPVTDAPPVAVGVDAEADPVRGERGDRYEDDQREVAHEQRHPAERGDG